MKHTSSTNQSLSGDSYPQEFEAGGDPVEDDPELATIAALLQETALYAINPDFKAELHKELLQQFIEHLTKETN